MNKGIQLLTLATFLTCPALALADDPAPPPPPPEGGGDHPHLPHMGPGPAMPPGDAALSPEERQELRKAHDDAMAANPDLAAEQKDLNEKMADLKKKIDAAMIKADPNVEPLLAKTGKPPHGGPGGPPPPPRDGDHPHPDGDAPHQPQDGPKPPGGGDQN